MFNPNKLIEAICAPFVAVLLIAICIWGTIGILNRIWLELLLLLAIVGTIAIIVVLLWLRFRRW